MSPLARVALAARAAAPAARRQMSGVSGGSMGRAWKDREHAAEELYFSKQDAEALAKLAQKMHGHAAPTPEKVAAEKAALAGVLEKHGVKATDTLLDEVRTRWLCFSRAAISFS